MHSPGVQIERVRGGEIDVRLGLVVARDVGAQDRIPAQFIAPRDIGHQRDVAVGAGREQELGAEPREAARHVGPRIEPVPGEIEIGEHVGRNALDVELRERAVEHLAMQHVELHELAAAGADLLHAG